MMSPVMRSLFSRIVTAFAIGSIACATAACADTDEGSGGNEAGDENDLTSVTARSRTLEFVGTVYVEPQQANDQAILQTVRTQAQTAFGPLRTQDIAVNSRELREINTSTFVKRNVKVVDGQNQRDMVEVKYTYTDNAVVSTSYARRSTVPLAVMNPSYRSQTERLLRECTTNDQHARDFAAQAWYVFEPKLESCKAAIRTEQEKINADRAQLSDPRTQVPKSEVDRLYVPITAKLGADKTNRGASYPDYHRLYKGGVKQDKLVISLVFGLIDHGPANAGPNSDFNWGELMTTLDETMSAQGGDWKVVAGPDQVDLASFRLASGRTVENPSIKDLVKVHEGGSSLGLSYADNQDLDKQFAERINKKWLAIEKPIKVSVGGEAPRNFAIQILAYFGAGSDSRPHKYATKNSDVFFYNGHSSIGYGPLDPRNFTEADFPSSYQILWVDGCVSYNYYHKDYIPLKQGGTENLDLITNGIEAPAYRSGHAMGQFLIKFLDGNGSSYRDLLLAARDTEALRVVDGELDNKFLPTNAQYKVTVQR
jgi:hypothetical protein